jgi:CxxC-x17-CxxC domain-containing protein
MASSDRELNCTSCGRTFLFTASEQEWFAQRGFQEPRRCKSCRSARKQDGGGASHPKGSRPQHGGARQGAMPSRDDRYGRPGDARYAEQLPPAEDPNGYRAPAFSLASTSAHEIDYAGLPRDEEDDAGSQPNEHGRRDEHVDRFGLRTNAPSSFGGHQRGPTRGPRARHDRAQNVHGPNGYRAPAFANSAPSDPRRPSERRAGPQAPRTRRPLHDATCAKCGAAARVPFQPTAERPALCKPCFEAKKGDPRNAAPST